MLPRVILFLVLGIINAILFFFMIWGPNGLYSYQELKKQYQELEKQKKTLDANIIRVSHEIRLLKTDKSYQEKMIRQRLRYIRNNELVYIFDDTKK